MVVTALAFSCRSIERRTASSSSFTAEPSVPRSSSIDRPLCWFLRWLIPFYYRRDAKVSRISGGWMVWNFWDVKFYDSMSCIVTVTACKLMSASSRVARTWSSRMLPGYLCLTMSREVRSNELLVSRAASSTSFHIYLSTFISWSVSNRRCFDLWFTI